MTTLNGKNLTLDEVHQLFHFHKHYNTSFESLLSLEAITEFEQQQVEQTRSEFDNHLTSAAASEGQVKRLTLKVSRHNSR